MSEGWVRRMFCALLFPCRASVALRISSLVAVGLFITRLNSFTIFWPSSRASWALRFRISGVMRDLTFLPAPPTTSSAESASFLMLLAASSAMSLAFLSDSLTFLAAPPTLSARGALLYDGRFPRNLLTRVVSRAFLELSVIFLVFSARSLSLAARLARHCLILLKPLPTPAKNSSVAINLRLIWAKPRQTLSPPLSTYSFISAMALMGVQTISDAPPVMMPRPIRQMMTGIDLSIAAMVATAASKFSSSGETVCLTAK